MAQDTTRTVKKLFVFAIVMFGFGYVMVPIYDVLCDITGLNGKTGEISQSEAETNRVDVDRLVTVEFDTNVNPALPWKFKVAEYKMKIHPGEIAEAVFIVENKSDKSVIGQAVPSVAPAQASLYFNKTECFCFIKQVLGPRERKEMIVRFVVDSKLPEKITTMTLSYTFFRVPDSNDVIVSDKKSVKAINTKDW
ncbi:MAG: cytochrome c oxidase assembly protein [Gammaproteobacteria bacterium]|nr:cytochrome c oxidase assembly protein [Pseudomonadota bacterium]TDJ18029.1 MAG: cytochrome c oxidase assembly protein [Gammaproteobacteria bacterium]